MIIGLMLVFLLLTLVVKTLDQKSAKELQHKPLAEIEALVYRYEVDYFRFIGEDNGSVQAFRQQIEAKDLASLSANWPKFRADFTALERKAGHKDRPLIMDFYYEYEVQIKELQNRTKTSINGKG
jgi:hypothetical protein